MFLTNRYAQFLTVFFVAQGLAFHYIERRKEYMPAVKSLRELPVQLASWKMAQETQLDPESQAVLRASDTLHRLYVEEGSGRTSSLFVAFFKTQRSNAAPHSPKQCLPGSGWVPIRVDRIAIPVAVAPKPIDANRYLVERGENKTVVIYWYQSSNRTVADEYTAKFFVVADAIRYNRTDTALVRVMSPYTGEDPEVATQSLIRFIRTMYGPLLRILPS